MFKDDEKEEESLILPMGTDTKANGKTISSADSVSLLGRRSWKGILLLRESDMKGTLKKGSEMELVSLSLVKVTSTKANLRTTCGTLNAF